MEHIQGSAPKADAFGHVPVLLERCIALLTPAAAKDGAVIVDATLGLGGHTEAMLARFPNLTIIGIDRDEQALERSRQRLAPYRERLHLVHAEYDEIGEVLEELGFDGVDGILFDLGVSSLQLDDSDRGFSYNAKAPLDMRMDRSNSLTAARVVNEYPAVELTRILRDYGDEKFAARIAAAIVAARAVRPIATTLELAELVREAIPAATRRTGGHPAKRSFQAIRVEVNGELEILRRALPVALDRTNIGGRVVVMSYQSLEDRLVKQVFAAACESQAPVDLPVVPERLRPEFELLTKGAELAGEAEIEANRRAKPVRLRAVERVRRAA